MSFGGFDGLYVSELFFCITFKIALLPSMMDLLKDAAEGNMDLEFMRAYTLYVANEFDEKNFINNY